MNARSGVSPLSARAAAPPSILRLLTSGAAAVAVPLQQLQPPNHHLLSVPNVIAFVFARAVGEDP